MKHDYKKGPLERGPRGPFTRHSGPVDTVVVHYLWTRLDDPTDMARVAEWHRARSFNGPGYHYLIRLDGSVEYGRPEWARGAHVGGQNDRKIGVAFEGGRLRGSDDGHDTRTPAQKAKMRKLIRDIKKRHPSIKRVVGHRDLAATQCPGFDVAAWWAKAKAKPAPRGAPAVDRDAVAVRRDGNPLWRGLLAVLRRIIRGGK